MKLSVTHTIQAILEIRGLATEVLKVAPELGLEGAPLEEVLGNMGPSIFESCQRIDSEALNEELKSLSDFDDEQLIDFAGAALDAFEEIDFNIYEYLVLLISGFKCNQCIRIIVKTLPKRNG